MRSKKILLVLMALVGLFALAPTAAFAVPPPASWNQTVEVVVPLREKLMNFSVDGATGGNGTAANPYPTYKPDISLSLTVSGIGKIVVTDKNGNVVFTYDKTHSAPETVHFDTVLTDGVGLYDFTATLSDSSDPNHTYDSMTIYVRYLPTAIIPIIPTPTAPNTGVIYFAGRAFLVRDIVIVFGIIVLAICAIIVALVRRCFPRSGRNV